MNNQDKNEIQANTLIDLPVADEQTEETKGGAFGGHVKVFDGATGRARGGVNDDGFADVIVGTGYSSTHVK
jgi:hypothetical protein